MCLEVCNHKQGRWKYSALCVQRECKAVTLYLKRFSIVEKQQIQKEEPFDLEFHVTAVSHYFQIKFCQPRYFVVGSEILRTQQGRHRNISDELSRVNFRIVVISNKKKQDGYFSVRKRIT